MLDDIKRTLWATADKLRAKGGQWVAQVGHHPLGVGGVDLPGLTHHDHPAVHQERRGGAGVDHGPDVELVHARPAELLDHHRRVPAGHQLLDHAQRILAEMKTARADLAEMGK